MRTPPSSSIRRLLWSRWLVLALMGLCLPLQGVLAVTMQMSMAAASLQGPAKAGHPVTLPMAAKAHAGHGAPVGHEDDLVSDARGRDLNLDLDVHHDAHAHAHAHAHHQHDHGDHGDHIAALGSADSPVPHDGGHGNTHASGPDGDHNTHHGCSFCAQCCIGAAIPVAPLSIAHTSPAEDLPVAAPAAVRERQPQTLDRPPKSILA